ncbi:MAG: hypothetical protein ACOYNS_15795 [Bacteroidota bacterium]
MKNLLRNIIGSILLVGFAFAQDVSVTASVDSQSVSIGDWIRYSVQVKFPSSVSVALPAYKDSIGSFEIVQVDSLVRTEANGAVELKKNYVISRYEAGSFYVQPYIVRVKHADGTVDSAMSNPIPVEIRGVEVDTSQTIKDVKPPMTVPMSLEEIALYIGILLTLAGFGYGLYYYIQKRKLKAGEITVEAKPNIPPHLLALMQLEELEAKRLWQAGEIKGYYSEATEIVRRYFESRYNIMALEMTTGEVMDQLKRFVTEKRTFTQIEEMLSSADLVKFAKHQPVAAENEQVMVNARSIIEQTKPVVETPMQEPAPVQNTGT